VTVCGWEGNLKSDIAVAMRRTGRWIAHFKWVMQLPLRAQEPRKGKRSLRLARQPLLNYLYLVMTINVTIIHNRYNRYEINELWKSPQYLVYLHSRCNGSWNHLQMLCRNHTITSVVAVTSIVTTAVYMRGEWWYCWMSMSSMWLTFRAYPSFETV